MTYLLSHAIDHHAVSCPERAAFRCGSESVTYGDLAVRSNRLARLLIERGVRRGDRVGVYLGRTLETAAAVFGILKAGAAYVPLDPGSPPARTRQIIDDCGIHLLISQEGLRRNMSELLAEPGPLRSLIGIESERIPSYPWSALADYPATRPEVTILEDDLAYIIYTSGSTGTPKGIMHTHRSGMAYARLSADLYGLSPSDVVGNHCALHYDMSTLGYFSAPLAGATTVIVTDAHTKFPLSLFQLMEREAITVWYSVPLALLQLTGIPDFGRRVLPHLRWVLFAGEVFAPRHLRDFLRVAPAARASNIYGPAEVNQCTYRHFDAAPEGDDPLPLGCVWGNTEVLIVDPEDRAVASGETGELLVRSATCMRGYWNRPERTAASFYYQDTGAGFRKRFYRTGDLVYRAANGELMFVGRADRQVKLRGHRVELEEVEALLIAQPGVAQAAVFVLRDATGGPTLAAVVVPQAGARSTADDWLRAMARHLPPHCLPARITLVDDLPRTGGGKVDRREIQSRHTA